MPTLTPAATVVGAPRVALPYGLFSVLGFRPGTAASHWEGGGVQFEYHERGDVGLIGQVQQDQSESYGLPKVLNPDTNEQVGNATAFTVYEPFQVTPVAWSVADAKARAEQKLLDFEQEAAEKQFWTGLTGSTPNLSETDGPNKPTDVGSWVLSKGNLAVAALEDFIATTYGSLGTMHMARSTALALINNGTLKADGAVLRTALGTPVVAGGGYPSGQIRATPALFGYRSEIFTSSNREGDLFDRGQNTLHAIAERTYLIGFDPTGVGSATLTVG